MSRMRKIRRKMMMMPRIKETMRHKMNSMIMICILIGQCGIRDLGLNFPILICKGILF